MKKNIEINGQKYHRLETFQLNYKKYGIYGRMENGLEGFVVLNHKEEVVGTTNEFAWSVLGAMKNPDKKKLPKAIKQFF